MFCLVAVVHFAYLRAPIPPRVLCKMLSTLRLQCSCSSALEPYSRNESLLPVQELMEHMKRTGSIRDFPGAEPVDREEMLYMECDILAPCATEKVINLDNAQLIKAKVCVCDFILALCLPTS